MYYSSVNIEYALYFTQNIIELYICISKQIVCFIYVFYRITVKYIDSSVYKIIT